MQFTIKQVNTTYLIPNLFFFFKQCSISKFTLVMLRVPDYFNLTLFGRHIQLFF